MDEIKRILILTADLGFGHRSAANAIAAALQKMHAPNCVIEIVNPLDDARSPAFLRDSQADYDKIVREMPEVYRMRYNFSDNTVPNAIVENALTVLLFRIIRDLFQRFKPDVVVSTNNMFPAPVSAVLAVMDLDIPALTVVTDLVDVHLAWLHDGADMILLPTNAARIQALNNKVPKEKLMVTGIPVNPRLVEETRSLAEMRAAMGWDPDLTTILVVGSKRVNNLQSVLHILNHSGLPMQMVIVAGGDDALHQTLLDTQWHRSVYLYNFVENMPDFLKAADCVISKAGGLIVTESLACGLPMLLIDVTPGQEEGNAEYVVKNGAGELGRSPVEALEVLCHWLEQDKRLLSQYHEKALRLGRPRSAFTAAELIWSAAEHSSSLVTVDRPALLPRLLDMLRNFDIDSGGKPADTREAQDPTSAASMK
jgi:1,2-diacylglycerol 3-beta-galactosyltransferase